MYTLEFSRLETGEYVISDQNDQRLFMIGQILLNDALRNGVTKALEYAPEFGIEKRKEIETDEFHVRISPVTESICLIKFVDKAHPEEILETDMVIESLIDLIDDYEDAVDDEADTIMLTRVQDTFAIEEE